MYRYFVAIVFMLLCSCSVSVFNGTQTTIPLIKQHKNEIDGVEFSDSGRELVFWTKHDLYIYEINNRPDTSYHFILLERIPLKENIKAVPHQYRRLVKHIQSREEKINNLNFNNQDDLRYFQGCFALYEPYNVIKECLYISGTDKKDDYPYGAFTILNGRKKNWTICGRNLAKKAIGYSYDVYDYCYLSPNGRYGYFIFNWMNYYGIPHGGYIPRVCPWPEWTTEKHHHVVMDIATQKILRISCLRFRNSAEIAADGSFSKLSLSRFMVAIGEKSNMIAIFDRKTGKLEIAPLYQTE